MCMGKTPAAQTPAPAPPPPAESPIAPVVNETTASDRNLLNSNRKGRNSLRIDKTVTVADGGAGLVIPTQV